MRVRPGAVYRNLIFVLGGALVFYVIYSIVAFDDGLHVPIHRRQKHLYLTVSKDRIGHRFEKLAPKRILMWTKVFGVYPTDNLSDCKGYSDRCIIDSNRSLLPVADAVVFHARDINDQPLPNSTQRRSSQRYVFMSMEAPPNSGRSDIPKNFFNWTATYLFQSDVIFKYGVFWLSAKDAELRGFKFQDYHIDQTRLVKKKSGIFGLISNCETNSKREVGLQELGKYMNITIAGKCASSPENVNLCPLGESCDDIISDYPFYVAIENTVCRDYITEKYWARIHIPSIPIVMRREIYTTSNIPPNSFIAMDDFKNPREMADYLISLESDSAKYTSYFAWRNGLWTAAPWNAPGYRNKYCRLCERLWEDEKKDSVIEDVWKWFDTESMCETDEFVRKWIKY